MHRSWWGKYTDKKYKNVFFDKNTNTIVFFGVLCRIFFARPDSSMSEYSSATANEKEWNSRDHVSPQECSADKAGLPLNYTNLEKSRGQVGFCAHTKLCPVVQLVSCNCLAEKSSHLVIFLGEKAISTCVLPSSQAYF